MLVTGLVVKEESLHVRSIIDFLKAYLTPPQIKQKNIEQHQRIHGNTKRVSSEHHHDFKETLTEQILFLLNELSLPTWFDKTEYVERCWQNYAKYLENNLDVKKYMTKLERRDVTQMEQKLDAVYSAINAIYESTLKSYSQLHKTSMTEFLDSDLPIELFTVNNQAYINKINVFEILRTETDRFQVSLHLHRGNSHKVDTISHDYERVILPIFTKMQKAIDAEMLLKYYIKINNSDEMNDLFVTKPLKLERLDISKFNNSMDYFREQTYYIAEFLSKTYNKKLHEVNNVDEWEMREFKNNVGQILLNYA